MKMTDLSRKCLVIAIWDKDSTTRDDYMAGIRINLRDIHQFDFRRGLVTVQLMAQDATDGHVGFFLYFDLTLNLIFSSLWRLMFTTGGPEWI